MVTRFVPCGGAGPPATGHLPERAIGDAGGASNGDRGMRHFTGEKFVRDIRTTWHPGTQQNSLRDRSGETLKGRPWLLQLLLLLLTAWVLGTWYPGV